jgi:hypothetical protein
MTVKLQYSHLEGLLLVHAYLAYTAANWTTLVYSFETGGWSYWTNIPTECGYFDYIYKAAASVKNSTICGLLLGDTGVPNVFSLHDRSHIDAVDAYNSDRLFHVVIVGSPNTQGSLRRKTPKMFRPLFQLGEPWATETWVNVAGFTFVPDFHSFRGIDNAGGGAIGNGSSIFSTAASINVSFNPAVQADVADPTAPTNKYRGLNIRSIYGNQWYPLLGKLGASQFPVVSVDVAHYDGAARKLDAWTYVGCDILYEDGEAGA